MVYPKRIIIMPMKHEEIVGGVPGESFTKRKGHRPFERPAKESDPEVGLQLVFDAITQPKAARKMIKTLEGGVPIEVVADSIATLLLAEGVISPTAIPLMGPALVTMIGGMGQLAGVAFESGSDVDPWTEPDEDEVEELANKISNAVFEDEEEPAMEEPVMEEPVMEEPVMEEPVEGLMSPLSKEGIV
tara:strand:- start:1375 stop:1938 length:564 start_codon:yes stop_codon:yes gene_type:complete